MAERRARWHAQFGGGEARSLVFVDESGADTRMTRLRGRSPVGERLLAHAPRGHYHTNTLIAAIRAEGVLAPCIFDGPINGEAFLAWVRQKLAPCLGKGDVVVLDNLSSHKVAGVREAVESAGASLLYLPPYSPDYNPIESMWGKIKACLRSLSARSLDQLISAFALALDSVSPSDCKRFFSMAGYDISFME